MRNNINFCGATIIALVVVFSLTAPERKLSWEKLSKLYTYNGPEPSKCWENKTIVFNDISGRSSANKNYKLCFSEKGFFLKKITLGSELESGILIPWLEIRIEKTNEYFELHFYPLKMIGTRFEIGKGNSTQCREMRSFIEDKIFNQVPYGDC